MNEIYEKKWSIFPLECDLVLDLLNNENIDISLEAEQWLKKGMKFGSPYAIEEIERGQEITERIIKLEKVWRNSNCVSFQRKNGFFPRQEKILLDIVNSWRRK